LAAARRHIRTWRICGFCEQRRLGDNVECARETRKN